MTRDPAVSGQFYPADRKILLSELESMIPAGVEKVAAIGAVVPHAGYIYSGPVAGEVYARLEPRGCYVILGPNHTGHGDRFACCMDSWSTPLGPVEVDREFLSKWMSRTTLVTEDPAAHAFEHSIEVQLPFIQKTSPEAKIIPITLRHGSLSEYEELAGALASVAREEGKKPVVIASSDMTHYEPREIAEKKDSLAIRTILDLDAEGLLEVVEENGISMCGYIPTAIMLMYAKEMGAKKAELVKYSDSGDVAGHAAQVVGYAGIIIY